MSTDLTDDALCGSWRILQRRRGHRYSLDDVATAWEAARARPQATRYLDLGCGIGSVLLMVVYKVAPARAVGLEAQAESFELAQRNVERVPPRERVRLIHGDLRDRDAQDDALRDGPFDLITGTPPYMPPSRGTVSPDSQRAHARAELRGGVEAYLAAASRLLADDGCLVVCADARHPERVLGTAAELALAPKQRRDVVPRATKGPLFSVWTLVRKEAREASLVGECPRGTTLVARDAGGGRTEQAHALRRFFDLPVNEGEEASP